MLRNIQTIHDNLIRKNISCSDLIDSCLQIIEKKDVQIHAFLEVFAEEARKKARTVDEKISQGSQISLLEGLPVSLKDNLLYKNHKVSAASKILENYVAPFNATAVEKLETAGAIIIGRVNMDEFALGSSTENSAFGSTKNPHDLKRVPGGTSGGSAAAVAAGMCAASLGSDTGGSIRQPAAFCGVVGLKPTYGAVSRYGLIAMSSSLDQIGPLTNSVEDAKIIFDIIKGKDGKDATTLENSKCRNQNVKLQSGIKNLKVGLPKEYFIKGLNSEIKRKIEEAAQILAKQGVEIVEISLPHTEYALAVYYILMPSEVSSNLARFDGIRYGFTAGKAKTLAEVYSQTRALGFGVEVKRRIILGTFALSAGYYDAYYKKACQAQAVIRQDFLKIFETVDFILTPTTPTTAFKLGEKINDPLTMYLSDIFTVSANLAGLPAISIPFGEVEGLPVGIQLMGKWFAEEGLFELGKLLEIKL